MKKYKDFIIEKSNLKEVEDELETKFKDNDEKVDDIDKSSDEIDKAREDINNHKEKIEDMHTDTFGEKTKKKLGDEIEIFDKSVTDVDDKVNKFKEKLKNLKDD